MIDDLTALRLQFDWGVDEAIGDRPIDRFSGAALPASLIVPASAPFVPAGPLARFAVKARTLQELYAEIDAFTGCALRASATHTVRPAGSARAPVVLIGDAPGSDDDRSGQAFSGEAGAAVDRVLRSVGWDRNTILLTTLLPWRPPGNRPGSPSEIQACRPFVHRLLGIVRPRAVVLLGAGPVAALAGQTSTIRQLRGKWLNLDIPDEQLRVPGLPILPLAQWFRDGITKQQLWSDLMLLQNAITMT